MADDDQSTRAGLWAIGIIVTAVVVGTLWYATSGDEGQASPSATAAASMPAPGSAASGVADGAGNAASAAASSAVAAIEASSASAAESADAQAASAAVPAAAIRSVASIYFATGQSALPADAGQTIEKIQHALSAWPHARVVLSGYHDASGDPQRNAELAKQRAFAVRDALVAAGVGADSIKLQKPQVLVGGGDPKEARRVDVGLTDPN